MWRIVDKGKFVRDVISLEEEAFDNAVPLLEKVEKKGGRMQQAFSEETGRRVMENLSNLPDLYREPAARRVYLLGSAKDLSS